VALRRLLVTANVPSTIILVTLIMATLSSSETLVLTRGKQRNIPEDAILQVCNTCHYCEYGWYNYCFGGTPSFSAVITEACRQ
jgi:hypothetical protein